MTHKSSFPPASDLSTAWEGIFPTSVQPPFPRKADFGGPRSAPGCEGTARAFTAQRGSRQLEKGPPIPSLPQGCGVLQSPLPSLLRKHITPRGPQPAAAQGYTWKSSAAGSASASVAAGPDQE